jgi:predicted amidophosphoribosyltransferase
MLQTLLSLLIPLRCAACGALGELWCEACWIELERLRGPCCTRCGAPTRWAVDACRECRGRRLAFAEARAAVAHRGSAASLVRAWKDRGLPLAAIAAAAILEARPPPAVGAVLCPVPGVPDRVRWRGVDGPREVAVRLAGAWERPLDDRLLVRRGRAGPQRGLRAVERRRNLSTAFECRGRAPASIVLVDDVYTTGATADACARALRRAGAREVVVVTFARALRT